MTYDVIVVGAGPAGSIAANESKKLGLETLLLEKCTLPRDKPCGGAVMYRGLRFIDTKVPANLVEQKIYGIRFEFPSGCDAEFKSDRLMGITVHRSLFDQFLAYRASDNGVDLIEDARVKSVHLSSEAVSVRLSNEKEFSGKILIGADGVNTIVGRATGLRSSRKDLSRVGLGMEADFHVGVDDVLKATNNDPSVLHMLPVKNRLAYGWIFPKREHLAIGIAGGALHMRSLRPMFEMFRRNLEKRLELDLIPEVRRTHFLGGWGLHNKNVTHRVMLIGDAAGWVDPMMGEGIAYAMMSGKISAEVANQAIQLNRVDEAYLSNYQSLCAKKCGDSFGMAAWAGGKGLDFAESLLSKASKLDIASELMAMVARGEICYSDIPALVARRLPKEIPGIIKRAVVSRLYTPVKKPS